MLCSGHSDAVLAVAAHPSSQFIFITSSRVCRIPHVCKYIIAIGKYYTVHELISSRAWQARVRFNFASSLTFDLVSRALGDCTCTPLAVPTNFLPPVNS